MTGFVNIAPELEPRVREFYTFCPVWRYYDQISSLLPNEIGTAWNTRIVVNDDGITDFQKVKDLIIPKIKWSEFELAEHARIDRDQARDNVKFWCFWGGLMVVLFLCGMGIIALNSGHACRW